MKKIVLIVLSILSYSLTYTQEKQKDTSYWAKTGKVTFLFNQSAFSNWVAGGDNSLAGNLAGYYEFNYKKEKWLWNNRIDAAFGLTKTDDSDFIKKTDDKIEINSLAGLKAKGYWSYSVFLNFKTQFAPGYEYEETLEEETRKEYTKFLSPGYLSFGPGIFLEKHENLKFNLSPLAARFTFVDKVLSIEYNGYFGVDPGKNMLFELGFRASAYAKVTLFENVFMENILAVYSNYLDKPQNINLDYTMNLDMKINSFLSANLIFQTIYNDNAYKGFQIREVFGIGVNYLW